MGRRTRIRNNFVTSDEARDFLMKLVRGLESWATADIDSFKDFLDSKDFKTIIQLIVEIGSVYRSTLQPYVPLLKAALGDYFMPNEIWKLVFGFDKGGRMPKLTQERLDRVLEMVCRPNKPKATDRNNHWARDYGRL